MDSRIPLATYRVQLTGEFGFRRCAAMLPYLSSLGVSTLYCSPVLQARAGSTHGYDTTQPTRLSEELGGAAGWAELLAAAQRHGMTLLLDIVPNHMAATTENPWWKDVLEHGRVSPYANVFDIDWETAVPRLRNRVMQPLLPAPLDDVIASGAMSVRLTSSGLVLTSGQLEMPLDLRSYRHVMAPLMDTQAAALPEGFFRLVRAVAALPAVRDLPGDHPDVLYALRISIKQKLMDLILSRRGTSEGGDVDIARLVSTAAAQLSPDDIRLMLREQNYVLDYWKSGRSHINYRRFFDINDLVGVRMEDEQVFQDTHTLLRVLAASGLVCGFRVDHVDGLRQPVRYLASLRSTCMTASEDFTPHRPYVVVEKILSGDEALPADWPVHGTTGYEFLNEVVGLLIDPSGLADVLRHHRKVTRTRTSRVQLTYDNKRKVLAQSFKPELSRLAHILLPVAQWLHPSSVLSSRQLSGALADATAALPVYRTYYSGSGDIVETDRRYIEAALDRAATQPRARTYSHARDVVRRALTMDIPSTAPANVRKTMRQHLLRWQQLTGASMAKGFEDTTLYQDSVFLASNDVGGAHSLHATSIAHFHRFNEERLRTWPHTMNCTATHDTKRGEDVRARLAVLSEMPDIWSSAVDRWFASLAGGNTSAALMERVDAATHLFLLQTIVGAWPEDEGMDDYASRLGEYMVKVAREAKTHSSWLEPNEDYEHALAGLVRFTLQGEGAPRFRECFAEVSDAVRFHGLLNSVAQVLLKATCPGVPDFYQGTELPDLSLVDPDNRRPIDYGVRESLLCEVTAPERSRQAVASEIVEHWPDARAKLYVTARTLQFRGAHAELFQSGSYTLLRTAAAQQHHVCAFMRSYRGISIIVAVPLKTRTLAGDRRLPLGEPTWGTETISLPPGSPRSFENAFTGDNVPVEHNQILLSKVFQGFPVALLAGKGIRHRGTGDR